MTDIPRQRYFAACAKGLEYLLVDELTTLGGVEVREALAGVHFEGDLELGYRACLWSRLASRIILQLGEFAAEDAQALYEGVARVEWGLHLGRGATLAVDAHGTAPNLNNSQFVAQKVKDAIVDRLRADTGARPDIDREAPDVRVNLTLRKGRGFVGLDLSGTALTHRGYRHGAGEAPLRENLAAAMLIRAGWPALAAADGTLLDPMCGSGTLPIEAAFIATDRAAGLGRDWFGLLGWAQFDAVLWRRLRAEADDRWQAGRNRFRGTIVGSDQNAAVVGAAMANARSAGVDEAIRFQHRRLDEITPPAAAPGLLIANPPYGERMGEQAETVALYRQLGDIVRERFAGWSTAFITSEESLARATGLRARRRYQLMNGALPCTLYCVDAEDAQRAPSNAPRPREAGAAGLLNRLRKNLKHLAPRLKREGIECYRAYDADLPEYAAAIDVYGAWLHIQEYAAPKDIPERVAERRFDDLVSVAAEVFDCPPERIATKTRRRQTREDQYRRHDRRGESLTVHEDGLAFEVNLFDFLDTGLFLDHRLVRARLRELAEDRHFLNLFCYTGSASVHAAAGGAASTTSVDLSGNYLDWAARNLAANGFSGPRHRLMQSDAMRWLAQDGARYDLIYVDPPTFSNSKRADDFDVQRHHVELLTSCRERLTADGVIVFSNHLRRFRLDAEALAAAGLSVRDVSRASIPFDFARDPRIHVCFELVRADLAARDP